MQKAVELRFKINAYTAETMPMATLAEYMADLAALLGAPQTVHFVRLESGSVALVHQIENEAYPEVEYQLACAGRGDAPAETMQAFRRIDRRLREDNADGEIARPGQGVLLSFPGRLAPQPVADLGRVAREGSIDGVLIKVGGKGDPVPVHVESGFITYSKCTATREMARKLGHHLFSDELRFYGQGQWLRDPTGAWSLDRFKITDFEVLDSAPLTAIVERLRKIEGGGWKSIPDPWDELKRLRSDTAGDIH